MPSLSKDSAGRSPYWICNYTTSSGRRLKKSTKQTEHTKAWEVCLALDRAEKIARDGAMTEQAAKKLIGEVLERATGKGLHSHRAGAWLDEWLQGKKETKAPKTLDRYSQVIRDFKVSLGARADAPLAAITAADVLAYRKTVTGAGWSGKTANNAVKIIRTAFNAALRLGHIPANPCAGVEDLDEQTAEREPFTAEQVQHLIAVAHTRDWKLAIVFAYYTGARLADVANARWNMIDLAAGVVRFTPKKTKKKKIAVVIPLHPTLHAMLAERPGIGLAFVFPSLAGAATGGKYGLSQQFGDIMSRAGIKPTVVQHTSEGRRNTTLSFHSLRHSFTSELANAGVSSELRMKMTGHTKKETHATYTHHDVAVLRAAVEKMPELQ